jgi:SAM-dependent methyltransferase
MKERILDLLVCPSCNRKLSLQVFLKEDGEVKEGLLESDCGQWYPIMNFVPRLLLGDYRGCYGEFLKRYGLKHLGGKVRDTSHGNASRLQVQRSFGSKWSSQPLWGTSGETKKFMKEWIMNKYGWRGSEAFKRSLKNRKRILDAGTGLGREAIEFCKSSRGGEVFGVDLSEAVEAAYLNTRQFPSIHIIQADLMRLPFKKKTFDFIFSEGVLHHTPNTKKAFQTLVDFLAPRGEIAVYVYKKKGPIREFCDDYIRQFTTKFSERECWEFSTKITQLGKALSDLQVEFEIDEDIPVLEMNAGKYDLQRFVYAYLFKCFWNERFTFDENKLINFDWYHPAYAWRHTPDELKGWCVKNNLDIIWWSEEESGITFRCQKKS